MIYAAPSTLKYAVSVVMEELGLPFGIVDVRVMTNGVKPESLLIEVTSDFSDTDATRVFELTIKENTP